MAAAGLSQYDRLALAARLGGGHPLAPRPSHSQPRAKNLIIISLTGGLSHVDSFDYKPELQAGHGKTVDWRGRPFFLNASPFSFQPYGESGLMISELFPQMGSVIDKLAVIRSLNSDHISHGQATLMMHTGSPSLPLPSVGSWISYALGTLNANLPSFVVLCSHLPYMGAQPFDASFLPAYHTGTRLIPGSDPIPNLKSPLPSVSVQDLEHMMLQNINDEHLRLRANDNLLAGRIASFDTADGMMKLAPQVLDINNETRETLNLYGLEPGDQTSAAWQCLAARRMVENGVRVVEVIHTGSGGNWDSHGNMQNHRGLARQVDQPIAALVQDLETRGMLDETLVVIWTEFGRAPSGTKDEKGRNHHSHVFTCLMAGGGVQGGSIYGQSDEIGNLVAQDGVHVHDFHATILHLMGLDHERLTYHYSGRDFRLTDVHGHVVNDILA